MKAWIVKNKKEGVLLCLVEPCQLSVNGDYIWWTSNSVTLNRNQLTQFLRDNLTYTNKFEIQIKIKEPKLCIQ